MQKIRGNKWNRRICKWIASLLTVALLVNQSSLSVLAEEISEEICQCDTRCSAGSVNEGCPVCAQDYGRCEGAEDVTDTDTGEETENPGEGEEVNLDTDTETVPDTDTDEETEDPDADESDTDADTDAVSDIDAEDEVNILLQDDVEKNVDGEDAVSPTAEGRVFNDGVFKYKIIKDEENDRQVEVTGHVNGTSVSGDLGILSTVSYDGNTYKVVQIGFSAFEGYSNLTRVTIPYGVNSIEGYAFRDCSSLTSIILPDSLTSIGHCAFMVCSNLVSITIPDSVIRIGSAAFFNCSSLESINIPDGVTSIESSTFTSCGKLKSIVIPDSVTSIEGWAFNGCSSLESITIPNGVASIEERTFSQCSSLTSITLPDSVTSIGYRAFYSCNSLKSITIPYSVTSIDMEAFALCACLNNLWIAVPENTIATPTVGRDCFQGCPDDRYLTFLTEDGTTELSETTTPELSKAVKAYDAADGIDDDMWYGWKLTKATYPVTINVNKDDKEWINSGKQFALSSDNANSFITDLAAVPNGTYIIFEVTGGTARTIRISTGVIVKVEGAAARADVDYYTVTFHYGNWE